MKLSITFLLLQMAWSAAGQAIEAPYSGELRELQILTLASNKIDTLPLVTVELLVEGKRIRSSITDFDGHLPFKVCSKQLHHDSLIIRTTAVGCHSEEHEILLAKDTIVTLYLTLDEVNGLTRAQLSEYNDSFFEECGTVQLEQAYELNEKYVHCDGRVLNFRELMEQDENRNEWEPLY